MAHFLRTRDKVTAGVRTIGKVHFIDNEVFTAELTERQQINRERLAQGLEPIQISRNLADKIRMLAEALSKKHYFIGYTYRDDMVSDGIFNCLQYIDKFNPDFGKNPLAYFNQVCFYAFLRRIQDEKKQSYVKYKIVSNLGTILQDIGIEAHDQDEDFKNHVTELLQLQDNTSLEESFSKRDAKDKEARDKIRATTLALKAKRITIDDFTEADIESLSTTNLENLVDDIDSAD